MKEIGIKNILRIQIKEKITGLIISTLITLLFLGVLKILRLILEWIRSFQMYSIGCRRVFQVFLVHLIFLVFL